MKILYICNIPSPYRVKYFEQLGEKAELTVVFERSMSSERDSSWEKYNFYNFRGIIGRGINYKYDSALSMAPLRVIQKESFDWVIIGNALSLSGFLEIAYLKQKKIPYWIEGDGAFIAQEEKKHKSALKQFMLTGARGYFSTCANHDLYYKKYSVSEEQIYRYPFSSIEQKDVLDRPVSSEEKQKLREKLGMPERYIVIAVGSFIHRKGFDLLLQAAEQLGEEIGIYFVGGTAPEKWKKLPNTHFLPFQEWEQLKEYYDAADVFAFPTREDIWGLVINEAMSRGLPVITTTRCNAGLELVEDGRNGYIIPTENVEELVHKINRVLYEDDREQMGEEALRTIRDYTIEKMVESHLERFPGGKSE